MWIICWNLKLIFQTVQPLVSRNGLKLPTVCRGCVFISSHFHSFLGRLNKNKEIKFAFTCTHLPDGWWWHSNLLSWTRLSVAPIYVGIKFIAIIPSSLIDTSLFVFFFCKIVTKFILFSRLSGQKTIFFSYFWLVTGALALHNFQEVDIISFPAHIFVRCLVPPPQVLLQSCQSPTCHLYSEGHGFTLHFCHAAGGWSTW